MWDVPTKVEVGMWDLGWKVGWASVNLAFRFVSTLVVTSVLRAIPRVGGR